MTELFSMYKSATAGNGPDNELLLAKHGDLAVYYAPVEWLNPMLGSLWSELRRVALNGGRHWKWRVESWRQVYRQR